MGVHCRLHSENLGLPKNWEQRETGVFQNTSFPGDTMIKISSGDWGWMIQAELPNENDKTLY